MNFVSVLQYLLVRDGFELYFCTLPFGPIFCQAGNLWFIFFIIQDYGAKGRVFFLISFLTLYPQGDNVGLVSNDVILHPVCMD